MAGPFDQYDIKFSQPLSEIDSNFYANSLLLKAQQYQQGYEQAQQEVDKIASFPMQGDANRKYLQDKINNLATEINQLKPDFADSRTLSKIKSLSGALGNDAIIQEGLKASAEVKAARDLSEAAIKKNGGSTINDNYTAMKISEWSSQPAGTPFNYAHSPYQNNNDIVLKSLEKRLGTTLTQRPNGSYWIESEQKGVDPNIVSATVNNLLSFDTNFQKQMHIDAWGRYYNSTEKEMITEVKEFQTILAERQKEELENLDSLIASSTGTEKEEYEEHRKKLLVSHEDEVANFNNLSSEVYSNPSAAKQKLYKLNWTGSLQSIFSPKITSTKYITNPLYDDLSKRLQAAKLIKELKDDGTSSKKGHKTDLEGNPIFISDLTPNPETNAYNDLSTEISTKKTQLSQSYKEIAYQALGDAASEYFETPQSSFDPNTGMERLSVYKIKPGKEAAVLKMMAEWYGKYNSEETDLPDNLKNYFRTHDKEYRTMIELESAKNRIDKGWESTSSAKTYQKAFAKTNIPYLNLNGKTYTKHDLVNAATYIKEREKLVMANMHTAKITYGEIRGGSDPVFLRSAILKEEPIKEQLQGLLKKYNISEQDVQILETLPPNTVTVAVNQLADLRLQNKDERDNYLNEQARLVTSATNYNSGVLNTNTDKAALTYRNALTAQIGIYKQTGEDDYYDKKVENILASKDAKDVVYTYRQSNGYPEIGVQDISHGTDDNKIHWARISETVAESLNLLEAEPEYAYADRILTLRRTGSVSNTGRTYNDALPYTTYTENNVPVTIKYHIEQNTNGYYLKIYKKVKGEPPSSAISVGEGFKDLPSLFASLKKNITPNNSNLSLLESIVPDINVQ